MIMVPGRERDPLDELLDATLAALPRAVRVELDHEASRYAVLDEVRRLGFDPGTPLCSGHTHDDEKSSGA